MDDPDTVIDVGHDDATHPAHLDTAPGEPAGAPAASTTARPAWPYLSATSRRSGVGNPLRVRL